VSKIRRLAGAADLPADKSILHRALICSSLAEGESRIRHGPCGRDCESTRRALTHLGVAMKTTALESDRGPATAAKEIVIQGLGPDGWREADRELQCGNSGTTMRLLLGALAGRPFFSVLTGDASLRRRPMGRVVAPLSLMGASIVGRSGNTRAPLGVQGKKLTPLHYPSPVPSAQVKSAILLAALQVEGETIVEEALASRDHSERMLHAMGAKVRWSPGRAVIHGPAILRPIDLAVPGDVSGAAFLLAAAAILPGSEVTVRDTGLNPTRTGAIEVMRRMGASVETERERDAGGEPVGRITLRSGPLQATEIRREEVPSLIDELPVLAVVATQARGRTIVEGAEELRVKESDRIGCLVAELRKLGARIEERDDGFEVEGPAPLTGAEVRSHGDHRLAMALAVAGLAAEGVTTIHDGGCADVSFPGFADTLHALSER